MPSLEAQQTARRVAAGASSIAALLVLAVGLQAHLNRPTAATSPAPRHASTLAQLSQLEKARPIMSALALTSSLDEEYCDCSAPTQCVEVTLTEEKRKLPGGGAAGLSKSDWGSWDPVTGVPRIDCPDTVTHAHYTRYKDKETGVEYISPTNRFWGSTMFAPKGIGLSQRGYLSKQEQDVLCTSQSGASRTSDPDLAPRHEGCPDPCAYSACNLGQSYTVQCPDHCFQGAGAVYGSPESGGELGPYEDTSSICRAAILSGAGTNDDSFYTTFTIVPPVRKYQDPGGGPIEFYKWDRVGNPSYAAYINDKCCQGGWPPKLGFHYNELLKWRAGFKNEWQNIRAFSIEGAVTSLCPSGYKFQRGSRKAGDPACVVSAKREYTPVEGCDKCVEDDGNDAVCGVLMPSGLSCSCPNGKEAFKPPPPPPPSVTASKTPSPSPSTSEDSGEKTKTTTTIKLNDKATTDKLQTSIPSAVPCPEGSTGPDDGPCEQCPAGTFKATKGTALCQPCGVGAFSAVTSATTCAECGALSTSDAGSTQCTCVLGATGPDGGACTPCMPGTYKSEPGSGECEGCESGKYSDAAGATADTTCVACPANSNAAPSSASVSSCTCNSGASGPDGGPCTLCEAGTYKVEPGGTACVDCEDGTYSGEVGATSESTCTGCPAGSFSPSSSASAEDCICNSGMTGPNGGLCQDCEAGTFKPAAGSGECTACQPGQMSTVEGAVSSAACEACPPNSFSGAGSSTCMCNGGYTAEGDECAACEAGKYKATAGDETCLECSAGTYTGAPGAVECAECPSNSDSAIGADACECDAGYTTSSGGCIACVPGKFKSDAGAGPCEECPADEFSEKSGAILCHDCPSSSHAEAGSRECVCDAGYTGEHESCAACTPGTFKVASGSGPCTHCSAGKYSSDAGSALCSNCPGHSVSQPGAQACDCTAGYTGEHDNCAGCAEGTYKGAAGSALCSDCEGGKYSAATATTACQDCGANSDSVSGSTLCLCVPGFSGDGSCTACTPGKYKGDSGSSPCEDCAPGLFAASSGMSVCDACVANADSLSGSVACFCNAGFAGAGDGCDACQPGKYKPSTGPEPCTSCAAGKYASESASVECEACEANSNSVSGSATCLCNPGFSGALCAGCAAGTFKAVAGSAECEDCEGGKYSAETSASACLECGSNADSVAGSVECVCNAGFSGSDGCTACAAGTYKASAGLSECSECASDTFSAGTGSTGCMDCAAHSQSDSGATRCECDPGFTGKECSPCAPGSHKSSVGSGSCMACEAGSYSDETGQSICSKCADHANSGTGATSCECVAGYTGDGHICVGCAAGTYKGSSGSDECTACQAGKFSDEVAADDSATCVECPAGKYSAVVGAYNEGVCISCPEGTYHGGSGGATSAAACTSCAAGKFSSIEGATDESACIGCAAGKASAVVGATDISSCQECPKNTFAEGASSTCISCPAGSAAAAGSTAADACRFSLAMRYELTREDYQIASKRMKEATAPFKTARDAMTSAIATYTESMYEAGGGKREPVSSKKDGSGKSESRKAYWDVIYKQAKPKDESESSRGRDTDSSTRGRDGTGKHPGAAVEGDEAHTEEERRAVTAEEKKIIEVAAKRVEKNEAEEERIHKQAAEARKKAEARYEARERADVNMREEAAKRIAAEEEHFHAREKARLANQLLLKAQKQAEVRLRAEEVEQKEHAEHGRSTKPLFKHVLVKAPCGGTAGDGSLEEECEEEPTGDAPRKVDPGGELPWVAGLFAKGDSAL